MTPLKIIYDAFLDSVTDDMYMELTPADTYGMLNKL